MRTTREEFLIERIFSKYGDALGGSLTVDAAYEELKKLSGENFGKNEADWRNWLQQWKLKLSESINLQIDKK